MRGARNIGYFFFFIVGKTYRSSKGEFLMASFVHKLKDSLIWLSKCEFAELKFSLQTV